jgi:hypothetical protein
MYAWERPSKPDHERLRFNQPGYMQKLLSEKPPLRLWAEEALYRVRKRQGRTSPMDALLEEYWAKGNGLAK